VLTAEEWQVVFFTLAACAASTLLILPFGLAMAWLLAKKRWRGKTLVESILTIPLVIPPVATGLILLKLFGRHGPFGAFFLSTFGMDIVFTWRAVVIAAAVMSFPLLVRAARVGFEGVDKELEDVALTLGAGPWRIFFTVTLPLALRAISAGVVLSFARAIGEFGATILLAGNIPHRTTTISLKIYDAVQMGQDATATRLVAVCFIIACGAIWISERSNTFASH
jgi:molybdate transport system permease protein